MNKADYEITKKCAVNFENAIAKLKVYNPNQSTWVKAELDGLESEAVHLRSLCNEYEKEHPEALA